MGVDEHGRLLGACPLDVLVVRLGLLRRPAFQGRDRTIPACPSSASSVDRARSPCIAASASHTPSTSTPYSDVPLPILYFRHPPPLAPDLFLIWRSAGEPRVKPKRSSAQGVVCMRESEYMSGGSRFIVSPRLLPFQPVSTRYP